MTRYLESPLHLITPLVKNGSYKSEDKRNNCFVFEKI